MIGLLVLNNLQIGAQLRVVEQQRDFQAQADPLVRDGRLLAEDARDRLPETRKAARDAAALVRATRPLVGDLNRRSGVDRFEAVRRRLGRSEAQRAGVESLASKHSCVPYLERALGARPDSFRRRRRWDKAARRLQRHRERLGVQDTSTPLGPKPRDRAQVLVWDSAQRDLAKSRLGLGLGGPPADQNGRDLSL